MSDPAAAQREAIVARYRRAFEAANLPGDELGDEVVYQFSGGSLPDCEHWFPECRGETPLCDCPSFWCVFTSRCVDLYRAHGSYP